MRPARISESLACTVRGRIFGVTLLLCSACGTATSHRITRGSQTGMTSPSAIPPDAGPTCPAIAASPPPPVEDCSARADGSSPVLDDFESGDLSLPSSEGRHGSWFTFTDGTTGCINSEVTTDSSSMALHLSGGGFTTWGAAVGTALNWSYMQQGLCSYDLSAYSGIRFRVRGNAVLRVVFPSRETAFASAGGGCPDSDGCYDEQGRSVVLTPDYQDVVVPFCSLSERGFGPDFGPLSLSNVTGVNFLIQSSDDFDVWLDDIAFVPRTTGQAATCAPLCPADELPIGITPTPDVTSLDPASTGVRLYTFDQATPDCGAITRRYLAYVPSALPAPTAAPIVMVLHGSSADAENMRFITQSRFEALADRDGFVVVYGNSAPSAATVPERPNGGAFRKTTGAATEVDDVAYLDLVVQDLVARGIVTGTNSVFLAGISDGGGLAYIAGANEPERYLGLALIAPFPGATPTPPVAAPASIIRRVLLTYSLTDPGMPAGYPSKLVPLGAAWAQAIGLHGSDLDAPTTKLLPDVVKEGANYQGTIPNALATRDSRAQEIDYGSDPVGPLCRVLQFDHAGHLWAVAHPNDDDRLVDEFGFRNQDMDMSDVAWSFFRSAVTSTSP